MHFHPRFASRVPRDPVPKFYPPPPGATGSPNDRYRQVPRSGGAIRNPNHRPYQYQYGRPETYSAPGAWPSAYEQQQRFVLAQPNMGQLQYHPPAGAFNQG